MYMSVVHTYFYKYLNYSTHAVDEIMMRVSVKNVFSICCLTEEKNNNKIKTRLRWKIFKVPLCHNVQKNPLFFSQ